MKAIVNTEYGTPDVPKFQKVENPLPKMNEVIIRVHAVSVNYGDHIARNFRNISIKESNMPFLFWFLARFGFGFNHPKMKISGNSFAGKIDTVGKVVKQLSVTMKYIAIIILMIFNLELIQAQDFDTFHLDKSHIVSFYAGFAKYIERDDAMSPFKYRGHSLPLEISYRYIGVNSRHIFYANFDNLRLRSSLPTYENDGLNHYVQNTNIQTGYSYLHRAFSLPECQSDLFFGGEINSLLNLRQHAYMYDNEFLMLDQINSLGFKAHMEKRFANKKQIAFASLTIPIISYVLMGETYNAYVGSKIDPLMNYSDNMLLYLAKKGDFVSFNKLVYFKTDFSFTRFLGNHIGVEFKYSLRYYKFTQYQDINYSKNLQSQLFIGIVGKL
ncbi:MAG: zinc-binding alcohol dehydrogenase family protein [Bacteroidales bacterium]|nr:zinc-binding alcohol dehydrogenase family protein [Bacteroidales bacterium]